MAGTRTTESSSDGEGANGLVEYAPGATFSRVVGRTFDVSNPMAAITEVSTGFPGYDVSGERIVDHEAEIRPAPARR